MTILNSSEILAGLNSFGIDSGEANKNLSMMLESDGVNSVFSNFLDGVVEEFAPKEPSVKLDVVMPE